jgi:hypothetical protein
MFITLATIVHIFWSLIDPGFLVKRYGIVFGESVTRTTASELWITNVMLVLLIVNFVFNTTMAYRYFIVFCLLYALSFPDATSS